VTGSAAVSLTSIWAGRSARAAWRRPGCSWRGPRRRAHVPPPRNGRRESADG
jgi:hypothetical protein